VEALGDIAPEMDNLSVLERVGLHAAVVGAARRGLAAFALDEGRAIRSTTPPDWVVRGPDMEGTWSGPSFGVAPLVLVIRTSWTPWEGARMRLDMSSDEATAELAASEARNFADALTAAASLVEGANR
jgi:hypothetical protein